MPDSEKIKEENAQEPLADGNEQANKKLSPQLAVQKIEAIDPPPENSKPSIMEVHHHPKVEKKNLKEYLLEGIMIFVAVTLGFFAETVRENISEKHRERDYIAGLINNVKADTSDLVGLIARNDLELRGIDTLTKISKNNFTNLPVQDSIFFYALHYTLNLHIFQFNDLTLVQLRNAGGYSLIKKNKVADSIALYEYKNNDIKIQEKFVTDYYVQTWNAFKQIFDASRFRDFFDSHNKTNRIPSDWNVSISTDRERMDVLYNNYWTYGIVLRGYANLLKEHLAYLREFLTFLKRNYDME